MVAWFERGEIVSIDPTIPPGDMAYCSECGKLLLRLHHPQDILPIKQFSRCKAHPDALRLPSKWVAAQFRAMAAEIATTAAWRAGK